LVRLSPEKKEEIILLIKREKKARLSWVATIAQVSVEELTENVEALGFVLEDGFIVLPTETKKHKTFQVYKQKRKQAVAMVLNSRVYRYCPGFSFTVRTSTPLITQLVFQHRKTLKEKFNYDPLDHVPYDAINYEPLRTIILPLSGKPIDVLSAEERPYIEQLRQEIANLPDHLLRLFITIKHYFELLVIPKYRLALSQEEISLLLERATRADNEMIFTARSMIQANIIELKTNRRGKIKKLSIRLPNSSILELSADQLEQQLSSILDSYLFELRKEFYNQIDLAQIVLQKQLD